jgi:hypothetical protein
MFDFMAVNRTTTPLGRKAIAPNASESQARGEGGLVGYHTLAYPGRDSVDA